MRVSNISSVGGGGGGGAYDFSWNGAESQWYATEGSSTVRVFDSKEAPCIVDCALMLSSCLSLSLVSCPVLCCSYPPVFLSPILLSLRGLGLTRIELTSKTNDCSEIARRRKKRYERKKRRTLDGEKRERERGRGRRSRGKKKKR